MLIGVAQGRTNREIAARARHQPRTVESHRENLMKKLGVRTVAGLTRLALEAGLVGRLGRYIAAMGKVKTGIVMMNLGGPANLDEVEPFLLELFADHEIIQLPFQSWLGPFIARRRTPQGARGCTPASAAARRSSATPRRRARGMVERLDRLSPETAPHQFYVAFRYVKPKSEDALRAMHADGVERAVAFTQYPQFSCSTTGSSLNELWRAAGRTGPARRVPLEHHRPLARARRCSSRR